MKLIYKYLLKSILSIMFSFIVFGCCQKSLGSQFENHDVDSIKIEFINQDIKKKILVIDKNDIIKFINILKNRSQKLMKFLPKYQITIYYNNNFTEIYLASWKNIKIKGVTFKIKKDLDKLLSKY